MTEFRLPFVSPCAVPRACGPPHHPDFNKRRVVPVTGPPGEGALYPELSPGPSGLAKRSYALIDRLRSVDKRRVRRVFGSVASEEMSAVDDGLALFLGLGGRLEPSPPQVP
jgi:hypothetical protein